MCQGLASCEGRLLPEETGSLRRRLLASPSLSGGGSCHPWAAQNARIPCSLPGLAVAELGKKDHLCTIACLPVWLGAAAEMLWRGGVVVPRTCLQWGQPSPRRDSSSETGLLALPSLSGGGSFVLGANKSSCCGFLEAKGEPQALWKPGCDRCSARRGEAALTCPGCIIPCEPITGPEQKELQLRQQQGGGEGRHRKRPRRAAASALLPLVLRGPLLCCTLFSARSSPP